MSIRLMTDVWDTAIGPATVRLVLLALADQANDEGVCWPFMATIASRAGCGLSTARKACADLEAKGLLRRELRKADDGDNDRSIYVVNAEQLAELAGAARSERGAARIEKGARSNLAGGPLNPGGITPSEPKEEPKDPAAAAASKPASYSEAFEVAWKAYGRKGAKRAAWAEWQRAIKRAPVEVITAGIAPYLANKPDAQYRKDFERWLKGDVWESADAQPAGQPAPDVMTFQEADAWLHARWTEGAAEAVATRTGHVFRAEPAPARLIGQDRETWDLNIRREWIKRNRQGLRAVLMGRPFQNGTEVQS